MIGPCDHAVKVFKQGPCVKSFGWIVRRLNDQQIKFSGHAALDQQLGRTADDRQLEPRQSCGKFGEEGLKCASGGTGPAQVAVAIHTAITALEGQVVPQSIKLPLAEAEYPNLKDGQDYYSAQSDNFFVGNSFPTCGINFTAQEIMGQTKENK